MSIRVTVLYIVVIGLCIYAWKDWFKSLCGLILMMAIISHEDMPSSVFGIQGLNPWNMMFFIIFLAWVNARRREGLTWDMPRQVNILLLLYLGVILIGWFRAVFARSYIEDYPLKSLISEELINTIKWTLPGILLFDGCRTRRRAIMALVCLLIVHFVIAVQVIRFMPLSAAYNAEVLERMRGPLGRYIGYTACDISTFLAGASWGILAALSLIHHKKYKILMIAAAGIIAFSQALTGGRAGFLAFGAIGFVLCILKWRKYLILAPLVVLMLPIIFPAATARMFSGFGETNVEGQSYTDDYVVTSGRMFFWPLIIEKIDQSPFIGYGRLGMRRSGIANDLKQMLGEENADSQPHNMYLETLLDNGIIGSLPVFVFWGLILIHFAKLFRSENPLHSAAGGLALSLTLAQLIAGLGSQHFYPETSTMCMWVAIFLALRMHVEEKRTQTITSAANASWSYSACEAVPNYGLYY